MHTNALHITCSYFTLEQSPEKSGKVTCKCTKEHKKAGKLAKKMYQVESKEVINNSESWHVWPASRHRLFCSLWERCLVLLQTIMEARTAVIKHSQGLWPDFAGNLLQLLLKVQIHFYWIFIFMLLHSFVTKPSRELPVCSAAPDLSWGLLFAHLHVDCIALPPHTICAWCLWVLSFHLPALRQTPSPRVLNNKCTESTGSDYVPPSLSATVKITLLLSKRVLWFSAMTHLEIIESWSLEKASKII